VHPAVCPGCAVLLLEQRLPRLVPPPAAAWDPALAGDWTGDSAAVSNYYYLVALKGGVRGV